VITVNKWQWMLAAKLTAVIVSFTHADPAVQNVGETSPRAATVQSESIAVESDSASATLLDATVGDDVR